MVSVTDIRKSLTCGRPACECGRVRGNVHCPAHDDRHPSLSINAGDNREVLVHCQAGCTQEAVLAALRALGLWSEPRNQPKPKASGRRRSTVRHVVKDADGVVAAIHERKGPWFHPDGRPSENGEIKPASLPLYGTERLQDLPDGAEIIVAEGEKATDALNARGIVAVGTFGTGAMPCSDSLRPLLRLRVKLWPDNDMGGAEHMAEIAGSLHRLGHSDVWRVSWEDAPNKGDAADFPADDVALRALLAGALRWEAAPAVALAELLDDVQSLVRKYVVVTAAQMVAIALWIAHTHAIEAADVTPYLNINSPEKRSGKTRLLEVLRRLVARPWLTARTSPAALYRRVDAESPTFLCDESDAAFKSGDEYSETLRGIFNSGFERGGSTTVCVGQGKNITYKEFSTFCPKAIAGIGRLPDTVVDRGIPIAMRRQAPTERAAKLRRRSVTRETEPLRESLVEWALAAVPILSGAEPMIPDELDDRAQDGWEPLFAIADLAGGSWPKRARAAALSLSVGAGREDDSLGVLLLRDIRVEFQRTEEDWLATSVLLDHLTHDDDAPWGDLKGKPLDGRRMAKMLRGYNVRPHKKRTGEMTARGYDRSDLADAFGRYLPPEEAEHPEHPEHTSDTDTASVPLVPLVPPKSSAGEKPKCRKPEHGPLVRFAVEQLSLRVIEPP